MKKQEYTSLLSKATSLVAVAKSQQLYLSSIEESMQSNIANCKQELAKIEMKMENMEELESIELKKSKKLVDAAVAVVKRNVEAELTKVQATIGKISEDIELKMAEKLAIAKEDPEQKFDLTIIEVQISDAQQTIETVNLLIDRHNSELSEIKQQLQSFSSKFAELALSTELARVAKATGVLEGKIGKLGEHLQSTPNIRERAEFSPLRKAFTGINGAMQGIINSTEDTRTKVRSRSPSP